MNIYAISSLVTAIASISLGGFVLIKNWRNRQSQVWALTSAAIFIWTFSLFWCFESATEAEALFWQRMLYIGTTLIPIFFYHYALLLLEAQKKYRVFLYAGYAIAAIFIIILFGTDLMISNILPRNDMGYWAIGFSNIYYFYLAYFLFYALLLLISLYRGVRAHSGVKKEQIRFVYYAALIGFVGGSFNFFLDFGFKYPVGNLFVFMYVFFITYAITRYRLMDIKMLIKRSTVFALLVVIIGAILVFLSDFLTKIFENYLGISNVYLTPIIIAFLVAIAFQPLRNRLEHLTNRFLFARGYNPAELLSRVSQTAASTIELSVLLPAIARELETAFQYSRIAFTLINKAGGLELIYQKGFDLRIFKAFIKGKEKVLPLYFSDDSAIKAIDELKIAYEAGQYQPKSVELLYALYQLNISLVIPLYDQKEILGVFCIGHRRSGDSYNQDDIKILEIIARQISLAIKNAALYQAVRNFNRTLQQKVDEQTEILKAANRSIQAKNKHLERLLQMRTEFLDIASHQLKTPVSVIRGTLSLFEDGSMDKADEAQKKKFISNMSRKAEKLNTIIADILRASEMDTDEFQFDAKALRQTQVDKVLADVYENLKPLAEDRGLKLELDLPSQPTDSVLSEGDFLNQALFNLGDNAIKYTSKGFVRISLRQENDKLAVTFEDSGIGIPKAEQKKLFDKFARAANARQMYTDGSGLGLFIVKKIVEAHRGGKIGFESTEGKGSKFQVILSTDKKQTRGIVGK